MATPHRIVAFVLASIVTGTISAPGGGLRGHRGGMGGVNWVTEALTRHPEGTRPRSPNRGRGGLSGGGNGSTRSVVWLTGDPFPMWLRLGVGWRAMGAGDSRVGRRLDGGAVEESGNERSDVRTAD